MTLKMMKKSFCRERKIQASSFLIQNCNSISFMIRKTKKIGEFFSIDTQTGNNDEIGSFDL